MNDQSRNQLKMILSKITAETDANVVLQKVRTCLSQFMKLLEQPHPIEMGLFSLAKIAQETIANRPERNCAAVVKIMGVLLDLSNQDWSNSSEKTRLLKVAANMMALLNPQEYDAIHQVVQKNGIVLAYRFRESTSFSVRYAVMNLIFEINRNCEPNKKLRESLLKNVVLPLDKLANLQSMLEWNRTNFQMKCRQYLHQLSYRRYHSSAVLSIELNDLTLHPIKDGSHWLVEWNTDPNTVCFTGCTSTDENAPTIEAEIEYREIKSFSIIEGKDSTKVKVSFKESLTLLDCSYSSVREPVLFIELLNADELAQLRSFLGLTLDACESNADISQEKVQNESFERQLTHEKVIDYSAVGSIQSDSTLNISVDSKENNNLSPGPVPAVASFLKPYALRPRNANNPGEPNTKPNQKKSPPAADPYDFCKNLLQEEDNCKWKTINARIRNKRTTQNTNISVQTMVKSKKGSIAGKQRTTTFATFRQKLSSTPTKAVNRFVMETLDANHPGATKHNMDGYETLSSIASDDDNDSDELYSPYKDLNGSSARGRKKRDTTSKKPADTTRRSRATSATALRAKPASKSYISKIFAQTRESRPINRYTRSVQNGKGNEQEKQPTEKCSYTMQNEQSFSQSSDSSTILHAQIQQIAIDVFDTSSTNISTCEITPKRGDDHVVQTNPSRGRRVSIEARQIHTQLEVHPSAVSTNISTCEITPKRGDDHVVQTNPSRGRRVSIEARQIHTQLEVHPSAVSTNISTSEIAPKRGDDRVVQTNPSRGRRVSIEARQIHTQLDVHPSAVSTAICRVQNGLHQQQYDFEYDTDMTPPQMVAHLANRTRNKERSLAQRLAEVQNATTEFVAKMKKEDNDLHTKLEQEEKECAVLLEKYVQKRRNMCEMLMQHKRSRVSFEEIDHQISKTDQQEQEVRTAAHQTLATLQQEESAVKRHGWAMYIEAFRRQMEEILRSACDP